MMVAKAKERRQDVLSPRRMSQCGTCGIYHGKPETIGQADSLTPIPPISHCLPIPVSSRGGYPPRVLVLRAFLVFPDGTIEL
jgi:hypothetical protein